MCWMAASPGAHPIDSYKGNVNKMNRNVPHQEFQ